MCIFSAVYGLIPGVPIFVLTNRDESTERPSLLPQWFESSGHAARWFGGADARAGGTWFGINERALLAAITNRKKSSLPPNPRSRGLLCRDVLRCATAGAAVDLVRRELSDNDYAGFNLIVLTAQAGYVIEAADDLIVTELRAGIHTVGNGPFRASDDRRVAGTQSLVERVVREEPDRTMLVKRAQAICALHGEDGLPEICMHREGWGTVGSTIAMLTNDRERAEYHYAAGPPCRTPYVDYSAEFRQGF